MPERVKPDPDEPLAVMRDARRLDWMARHPDRIFAHRNAGAVYAFGYRVDPADANAFEWREAESLRDAIDAGMAYAE